MNNNNNISVPQMQKCKNIELLRFLFAWAVVGFHVTHTSAFKDFGLDFLKPYLNCRPCSSVPIFFIMAFFFFMLRVNVRQSFWDFCKSKWLRLAPLIIVVSMLGYAFHLAGYWGWNWFANIENVLLIHDWAAYPRRGTFVHPAWYCSTYFLLMCFYFALFKTVSSKYLPLIIGFVAYVGWRTYILGYANIFPRDTPVLGHSQIGMAVACAGLAYALVYAYQKGDFRNIPGGGYSLYACRAGDVRCGNVLPLPI